MAKRIEISIRERVYPILADEDENYLRLCATIVERELAEVMDGSKLTLSDGAILAALNIADKYCKEREVSDSLRRQLKDALDENTRLALKPKGTRAPRAPKEPREPRESKESKEPGEPDQPGESGEKKPK